MAGFFQNGRQSVIEMLYLQNYSTWEGDLDVKHQVYRVSTETKVRENNIFLALVTLAFSRPTSLSIGVFPWLISI